jgi:tRNA-splicing ligase RtcB
LEELDEDAMTQAKNLANLPFAFRHIAIMPDAHVGFGMPIGGVLATRDVVIPNAVGKDIGCGMCALSTDLTHLDMDTLKKMMICIRREIPVGFRHHERIQDEKWMPVGFDLEELPIVQQEYHSAKYQVGTLGSGNHFIEIQRGDDGYVWLMVHSGSRNIGKKVADHYDDLARDLNEKWFSTVDKKIQLSFLPLDSDEGQTYLKEMTYCVEFAFSNRLLMMERIQRCLEEVIQKEIRYDSFINIAHNYAAIENHFGQDVVVHRKGATSARDGEKGIIPGSQGTASYIVEGLGNHESFMSCSHGAGRVLGRRQAMRELDLERERMLLDEKGIIHAVRGKRDLDEAPGAYKNIDEVMKNQEDLVRILVRLEPLAVVKG